MTVIKILDQNVQSTRDPLLRRYLEFNGMISQELVRGITRHLFDSFILSSTTIGNMVIIYVPVQ